MSGTVVAIGLAHGIPVLIAGGLGNSKVGVVLVAVAMGFVAVATGTDRYLGADLIGVALGAFGGWAMVRPKPSDSLEKAIAKATAHAKDPRTPPREPRTMEEWRANNWHKIADLADAAVLDWRGKGWLNTDVDPYELNDQRILIGEMGYGMLLADPTYVKKLDSPECEARMYKHLGRYYGDIVDDLVRRGLAAGVVNQGFVDNYYKAKNEALAKAAQERQEKAAEVARQYAARRANPPK